ncbi:MAG: ThiF family adenylyltransferase [Myxococcales bacterium]
MVEGAAAVSAGWSYERAFQRNLGLVARAEQACLRDATVAIAGAGGVGGSHALTLARQGVGGFKLIDPDTFSVANLNRQAGARLSSLGAGKAAEIGRMVLDVNPEARVEVCSAALGPENVDAFIDGADVVLDGLDFFALPARRLLFRKARDKGLWGLTAGPMGFSGALLAFSPRGMRFDDYFDFGPDEAVMQNLVAFLVGLAPRATQLPYTDMSSVDVASGAGPSSVIACQLCSSLIAVETVALLLGRRPPLEAPAYLQFDAYRRVLRKGRLWFGNRGPIQRLKRAVAFARLRKLGVISESAAQRAVLPDGSKHSR